MPNLKGLEVARFSWGSGVVFGGGAKGIERSRYGPPRNAEGD